MYGLPSLSQDLLSGVHAARQFLRAPEVWPASDRLDDWRMGVPPRELWVQMIDLIYSGNMTQAFKLFDLAWPGNVGGKDDMLLDFKARLKESPFYQEILSIGR